MSERDIPEAAAPTASNPVAGSGFLRPIGTPAATAIAVVTTLIGLIVLAWAILFVTKGRFLRHPFESIVGSATGREVKVAGDFQFYFAPFDLKLVTEKITVSNPEWAGQGAFFRADRVEARIATFASLFGRDRIDRLALDNATLDLQWDDTHRRNSWTFGDPSQKGEPLDIPLIRRARAAGTDIRYTDPKNRLAAVIDVETVEAADTRFASAVRFSGKGRARGFPFVLQGALLSPNATASGGQNRLALRISGARTVADISGTLPGATQLEGARLKVDVRGANMADLFEVGGIAVPDTRRYRLRSALTKHGIEWRFSSLSGKFGDSDIAGALTIANREPRLMVTADLSTATLDIVDIAPFIGYNPDRIAARGKAGAISQVNGAPRVLPDAPLRVEALKNFDADVKYRARRLRAPNLPVSNIALALTLKDRLLSLSPLTFAMARGQVSADVAIDARQKPVLTKYDIRLSPTPMGVLLAGFGVSESGTSGTMKARVQLTGRGDTVHDSLSTADGRIAVIIPKGTFWTRNVELSELDFGVFVQKMFEKKLKEPVQINCGLVGFSVRNGVAAADPILIDTTRNVIVGRGGFSFKSEAIDMAFRADGKKFSLFSAQSPVGLGGYFAKPSIDVVSPELLARAGAGLGLGVLVSPLAAVVAFVDIGDAKAADCGPVLAGARAAAQRDDKGRPRKDVGKGTTAKSESGKQSGDEKKKQRKKFLGIF